MDTPVLILFLEDNPQDAELVRDRLQEGGVGCELRVATDRAEYEAALAQTRFDVILSDYSLPDYDGMAAMALARARQPDVPFIMVSGMLGEEQAVDCVVRGATDYVLKQKPDRLVPAVLRALREVEERRKRWEAEESLRASEVRYRRLFEAAKDGILILDAETGVVVDVNPFLIELLGHSRETILGKKVWELGSFKDLFANQDSFEELQQQGYIRYEDKPLVTIDGRRVEVEFISNVYLVNGYKVIQCNVRDITERKRAEEELRSARAFLGGVVNAIADPVFVKDDRRRFVLVNDALCAIVGRPREGLLGKGDEDMFPKEQAAVFRQMDDKVLDTGEENANEETLSDLSSGEVRTIITRKTRHIDPAGKQFLVGVIRDITERKRAEEQLRQSQKMEAVGQLAGGVAHDFNNLLQAMLSLTQMLVGHLSDPERLKTDAAELEQQVRRGASLTRQLLQFSRRETVRLERLDLNEVVRDGITLLRRLLKANVAIEAPLAEGQLPVKADRGQFGQVLLNLSVNAADAMPDGGRLDIRTGSEGATVWLKVTDTGGGIPAAIREHIFEPFFTTKGQGKGTGLGLSVVHGIVTQLGGTVAVESHEGQGTTFTVTLPRAGSDEIPAVEIAERGDAPPRGHGERVLVVEDEDSARLSLAEILTVLGYMVTAVSSGEEAGRLPPEKPFDVLLTDLMLPGISGGDLAIGLQGRWPDLRVVLMSGYTEDEAVRVASRVGKVRFLQKPFDIDTLSREVRAALETA